MNLVILSGNATKSNFNMQGLSLGLQLGFEVKKAGI